MAEGHFGTGSMLPKIEACIRFLQRSAKPGAAPSSPTPKIWPARCTAKPAR